MKRLILILIGSQAAAAAVFAAMVIDVESRDLRSEPRQVENGRIYVDGSKMAMSAEGGRKNRNSSTMIFRGDLQLIWHVNHTAHSYTELNRSTVSGMGDRMKQSRQRMEARMARMPPEQRVRMEQMMKGRFPPRGDGRTSPVRRVVKTGETETFNGYPCVKYEVTHDGETVREVWATPWDEVGVAADDFDVLEQMAEFFEEMSSSLNRDVVGGGGPAPFRDYREIDGFPVVVRHFTEGVPTRESTMSPPKQENVDDSVFSVPEDYKEEQGRGSRRGMGRVKGKPAP